MIDDKENHRILLQNWHKDWAVNGKPIESTAPTLKTFLANEAPYSNEFLFEGRLRNIQPIFEFLCAGKDKEPEAVWHPGNLTTLEKACGLGGTSHSEKLLAQVASFASEQTRNEANCAALSFYSLGLTPSDQQHLLFEKKEASITNFHIMKEYIRKFVDADSDFFLARFFSCSVKEFTIQHGGYAEKITGCIEFWIAYASWRSELCFTKIE